jgi:predicted transcriptional regulator
MVRKSPKKSAPPQRIMPFPLRLEPGLRKKLQALADADRRALSVYILIALEKHVAERERTTALAAGQT